MGNPPDRVADSLGGWVIDDVLGRGGFATVYRAHQDTDPHRAAAVKVLDGNHRGAGDLDRLHREFDIANRVAHPHVVAMYDRGEHWLAMELLGRGTVAGFATIGDLLSGLADVAGALDHVHRLGVVHCDVKPSNVLVGADGAVLVDFGVAYVLGSTTEQRTTHVEASLPYAAPEVLRGHPPVAATDEYALACAVVELLLGKPPFTVTTTFGLIDAHLNAPVPRYARRVAWISHAFDSILAKAMAKDPDRRYSSCTEFVSLITHALLPRDPA